MCVCGVVGVGVCGCVWVCVCVCVRRWPEVSRPIARAWLAGPIDTLGIPPSGGEGEGGSHQSLIVGCRLRERGVGGG